MREGLEHGDGGITFLEEVKILLLPGPPEHAACSESDERMVFVKCTHAVTPSPS